MSDLIFRYDHKDIINISKVTEAWNSKEFNTLSSKSSITISTDDRGKGEIHKYIKCLFVNERLKVKYNMSMLRQI